MPNKTSNQDRETGRLFTPSPLAGCADALAASVSQRAATWVLPLLGAAALGIASLVGCGSAGGADVDLEAKNGLWLGQVSGKMLILYTYAGDTNVLMDVRSSANGPTEAQYQGSRIGTPDVGYSITLTCLDPGASACADLGNTFTLDCATGVDHLACSAIVFSAVMADQIAQ